MDRITKGMLEAIKWMQISSEGMEGAAEGMQVANKGMR
jgi:hypothetical protein